MLKASELRATDARIVCACSVILDVRPRAVHDEQVRTVCSSCGRWYTIKLIEHEPSEPVH